MDGKFGPSFNFQSEGGKRCSRKVVLQGGCSSPIDNGGLQRWQVEEVNDKDITCMPQCNQYYVENGRNIHNSSELSSEGSQDNNANKVMASNANQFFFKLPWISLPRVKKIPKKGEPCIDYSKSIWMMKDQYLQSLDHIAKKKEAVV